jgi:hypothetical protein
MQEATMFATSIHFHTNLIFAARLQPTYILANKAVAYMHTCKQLLEKGGIEWQWKTLLVIVIILCDIFPFGNLAIINENKLQYTHPLHFFGPLVLWLKTPVLAPSNAPIRRPLGLCNKAPICHQILC